MSFFSAEGVDYFGFLKLNYKTSYTHATKATETGENLNDIILQKAILPSAGQKLSEAFLVNLSNGEILLTEKKFRSKWGKEAVLFPNCFMECHAPMSQKTKLDIVTKAVEQVNKKYYGDEDTRRKMEVKQAIYDELEEKGSLEVEAVKEKVFKDSPQMQADLEEKLEKYNMEKEVVRPKSEATIKKFQKQHLTTDTGIEITIPMEEYKDPEKVEFNHKSRRDDFRADQKYRAFEHQIKNALISTFRRESFYAFVPKKDHNKACSGLEKRFKSSMIKKKGKMEESLLWQEK